MCLHIRRFEGNFMRRFERNARRSGADSRVVQTAFRLRKRTFYPLKRKNNFRSKLERTSLTTKSFWWRCGQGTHPFPSRTRWLRPVRPMVLYWRRYGRVGGRQIYKKNWILPVIRDLKRFKFLMTDKDQSRVYIENCIQKINQFSNIYKRKRHPR